jgi:hypothetical protein
MDPKTFNQPPVAYRPVIFWSWNGELKRERLREQIAALDEAGYGGFFMHARDGLKIEYMGEDWFDIIRFCIGEAKARGMEAWLYDENGWPSGFAGGEVPRESSSFRAKALVMDRVNRENDEAYRLLAVHKNEDKTCYLYEWLQPLGNPRFHGASYVDLLHPETTWAFIRSTYEKYRTVIGDDLWEAIPGVFSDEACALLWLDKTTPALPWTEELPAKFSQRYGYDIRDQLTSLFLEEGSYREIRYDYWKLVVELMTVGFSQTIYEWCDRHGLLYTGHYMAEDRLSPMMNWIGDTMPHYEYMHIPGMDHLGRDVHRSTQDGGFAAKPSTTVMSAKQVTSVAHQLGKERALSELFACAGQGFSLAEQKRMTDWHLVHGINYFTPHLMPYTMQGGGKRDYPPTIGPQQPWWPQAKRLTDYQARMSYALTRGVRVTKTLVIHPIESAWELYAPLHTETVDELNGQLEKLCLQLLDRHVDFDFGNELLLEKYGEIRDGQWRSGNGAYEVVVIPCCTRLRESTRRQLRQFADAGGAVRVWDMAGWRALQRRYEDLGAVMAQEMDLADFTGSLPTHDLSLMGENTHHIWLHQRREADRDIYFLANLSLSEEVDAAIALRGCRRLEQWDAETGEVAPLAAEYEGERTVANWRFQPGSSLLLYVEAGQPCDEKSFCEGERSPLAPAGGKQFDLTAHLSAIASGANTVVLDRFQRSGEETSAWSEPIAVCRLREMAANGPIRLRAAIEVGAVVPEGDIYVVAEQAPLLTVAWNGQLLTPCEGDWLHMEHNFYRVPAQMVTAGRHHIEFELEGGTLAALENMHVLGSFRVDHLTEPFTIHHAAGYRNSTDFIASGFPFYAGKLTAKFQFRMPSRAGEDGAGWKLKLQSPALSAVQPIWNGNPLTPRVWGPWEWDVTALAQKGIVELELEAVNDLRNLLGPHHLTDDHLITFLRPDHYAKEDTGSYILQPFELGVLTLNKYYEVPGDAKTGTSSKGGL